jgi:flavin-binding protein dodecin
VRKVQIRGALQECGDIVSIAKVIEVVGASRKSWDDAIQTALDEAARTVENIVGIDVVGMSGKVENNRIIEYKADVKIAFVVERK